MLEKSVYSTWLLNFPYSHDQLRGLFVHCVSPSASHDNFWTKFLKIGHNNLSNFFRGLHIVERDLAQSSLVFADQIKGFVEFCSFFPCSLTVVHRGRQRKSCIVAWLRQTFWFRLNFLLPKNESVLNILGYFLEQFQIFSRGLQPLENL